MNSELFLEQGLVVQYHNGPGSWKTTTSLVPHHHQKTKKTNFKSSDTDPFDALLINALQALILPAS